jgi:DHA1 family bicyclomycin/chloramphenicol resistance-like MFS transporter
VKLRPASPVFSIFLGMLAALPPLSIDMALPALVPITAALRTTPDMAGLTLSLFMAGFAISPIAYGPLADRFGRRPVLFAGLVLFTAGGLAATFATSIALLLGARLAQGAGAGAGMTLAFTITRDLFEGCAAQTRFAVITVVANIAPIVAPTLGAVLLGSLGWRGIYGVTALSGVVLASVVVLGLAETRPSRSPTGPMLPCLARDYRRVLAHHETLSHIAVNALGFGWMFAYVAGSPLVFLGVFHLAPALYAAIFACTGSGIVAGAGLNGWLARHAVPPHRVLLAAILFALAATIALVGLTVAGRLSLPLFVPLLVLATTCFGLAAPSAAHGALDPVPDLAGIAGGLLTSMQMLTGAVASLAVALLFPALGALAMAGTMAVCALAALVIYLPCILPSPVEPLA